MTAATDIAVTFDTTDPRPRLPRPSTRQLRHRTHRRVRHRQRTHTTRLVQWIYQAVQQAEKWDRQKPTGIYFRVTMLPADWKDERGRGTADDTTAINFMWAATTRNRSRGQEARRAHA